MQDDATPFQDKIVDILNYGSLNLAIGLGYRAGLFDIMDANDQPCTVDEICAAAGWFRPCIAGSMSATWDAPRGSPPS